MTSTSYFPSLLVSLFLFFSSLSFSSTTIIVTQAPAYSELSTSPLSDIQSSLGINHDILFPSSSSSSPSSSPSVNSLHDVSLVSSKGFDEPSAVRYRYYTSISYASDLSEIIGWNCSKCLNPIAAGFVTYELILDNTTDTLAYIGVNENYNEIAVVFRGSANLLNWIYDFEFWKTPKPFDDIPGVYTASGFYDIFSSMRPSVFDGVTRVISKYPSYDVKIIGHSLGAAVADLHLLDFAYNAHLNYLEGYTFGNPRCGNGDYSGIFNQYVANYWRMTNYDDPVPHVPLVSMGFSHIPHEMWEYWANNSYIHCNWALGEDPNCADSLKYVFLTFDVYAHTHYMNVTDGANEDENLNSDMVNLFNQRDFHYDDKENQMKFEELKQKLSSMAEVEEMDMERFHQKGNGKREGFNVEIKRA